METTSIMKTFYFCLYLTESEHWCMESTIDKFLKEECPNTAIVYYRQLKEGHIPMHREVKLIGPESAIQCFKRWFSSTPKPDRSYALDVVKNPHRVKEFE